MGPSVHSKNTTQSFFLRITPNRVSGNRVADGRAIHQCAARLEFPMRTMRKSEEKSLGQCSLSGMKAALGSFCPEQKNKMA